MAGDLLSRIETSKKQIEEMTSETLTQDERERRIALLDDLLGEEQRDNRLLKPHVFLSFAGAEGEKLIEQTIKELGSLRVPGAKGGFRTKNGMSKRGKPNVLQHIREKMTPCCIFLGILTPEFPLVPTDGLDHKFAPGAWVLLEAGIALALGLEVIFLVEKRVHPDFWKNAFGHVRHARFDLEKPAFGLGLAGELVKEHYIELRKNHFSN